MPRTTKRLREAPEGSEKYCAGCSEWWPADGEFWHIQRDGVGGLAHQCRACYNDWQTAYRAKRRGDQPTATPAYACATVFTFGLA